LVSLVLDEFWYLWGWVLAGCLFVGLVGYDSSQMWCTSVVGGVDLVTVVVGGSSGGGFVWLSWGGLAVDVGFCGLECSPLLLLGFGAADVGLINVVGVWFYGYLTFWPLPNLLKFAGLFLSLYWFPNLLRFASFLYLTDFYFVGVDCTIWRTASWDLST
jgi:hypothetical protein